MSATITASDVKALRDQTGAGMMDCKSALQEAGGDFDKAVEIIRVKMGNKVGKLAGRETTEGTVQSYIHANGKLGALVEVDCNTDFVATNEDFVAFAKDVALHIAGSPGTQYVSVDDQPAAIPTPDLPVEPDPADAAAAEAAAGGPKTREGERAAQMTPDNQEQNA